MIKLVIPSYKSIRRFNGLYYKFDLKQTGGKINQKFLNHPHFASNLRFTRQSNNFIL